jgi:hypothetical protein
LSPRESETVVEIVQGEVSALGCHLLVGALRRSAGEALAELSKWAGRFRSQAGTEDAEESLRKLNICGFTVCPPAGKDLSQAAIRDSLVPMLEQQAPISLYQLPQVTENEMSAELVTELAERFSNFYLFKDTSGHDRVALSHAALGGVFLVRGAEGDYIRWLAAAGGPYAGFLLSTANSLALPLHQLIELLENGRRAEAENLSERLTSLVTESFRLVATVGAGNPFANANKAMDHFFAYGPHALAVPPPRLHAGSRLPMDVIRGTGEALRSHGFMPDKGYLE